MVSRYANAPETPIQGEGEPFDPTQEPAPQGKSTDASDRGTLSKMWDAWTSHPENNAAMINFGLQMMQPLAPGQTQLGHFAQSIGAGGEALGRNVAAQQEREQLEQKSDLAEREETRKEAETAAYRDYVKAGRATQKPELLAMQQRYKDQVAQNKAWQSWLAGKDLYLDDTLWKVVKAKYPQLKDKGELASNPEAFNYARAQHARLFPQTGDDSGGGGAPAASGGGGTYPEGTIIGNGTERRIMRGGRWVPLATTE